MFKCLVVVGSLPCGVYTYTTENEIIAFKNGVTTGAYLANSINRIECYFLSDLGRYGIETDSVIKKHLSNERVENPVAVAGMENTIRELEKVAEKLERE